jgi:hypothetical protein
LAETMRLWRRYEGRRWRRDAGGPGHIYGEEGNREVRGKTKKIQNGVSYEVEGGRKEAMRKPTNRLESCDGAQLPSYTATTEFLGRKVHCRVKAGEKRSDR